MDEDEDYVTELLNRDDEISRLQSVLYELSETNANMKQTIHTLLKKCTKNGEFYTINVVFDPYMNENIGQFNIVNIQKHITNTKKDHDIVTILLFETIVGKQKKNVPFVFVDRSTLVYKTNEDCHLVIHVDDLVSRLYMILKTHMNKVMHGFLQTNEINQCDMRVVTVLNLCLEFESFQKCAKKAMKLYETLFK